MRTTRGLAVLIFAATLLLSAGCAVQEETAQSSAEVTVAESTPDSEPAEPATPRSPESPPASAAEPATRVAEELRFTSVTLDGEPFEGAGLAGQKAVLWFWAPWCPNCQREAPGVGRVAEDTAGEVTFVGVAAQDDVSAMQGFVDDYDLGSFDHLADVDAEVWQTFGVTYQPAYAFIGPDGSVEVVKGGLEESELAERVDAL